MADNPVISPTSFFSQTIGQGAPSTDYHRQYLFQVILQAIPGVSNASIISYFIASSSSPVETTGMIPVDWMNSQVKLAGRTTYAEWTVTVRDDATSVAYNYFKLWRRLVYETKSGQSNIPKDYKYALDLYLLNNRGEQKRGYKLVNAWPTSIGAMTLDQSTEAIITFPVTLQYDEFLPIPL
jgi:hypothetical protein